jgi:hypothetical protein
MRERGRALTVAQLLESAGEWLEKSERSKRSLRDIQYGASMGFYLSALRVADVNVLDWPAFGSWCRWYLDACAGRDGTEGSNQ